MWSPASSPTRPTLQRAEPPAPEFTDSGLPLLRAGRLASATHALCTTEFVAPIPVFIHLACHIAHQAVCAGNEFWLTTLSSRQTTKPTTHNRRPSTRHPDSGARSGLPPLRQVRGAPNRSRGRSHPLSGGTLGKASHPRELLPALSAPFATNFYCVCIFICETRQQSDQDEDSWRVGGKVKSNPKHSSKSTYGVRNVFQTENSIRLFQPPASCKKRGQCLPSEA